MTFDFLIKGHNSLYINYKWKGSDYDYLYLSRADKKETKNKK